MKNVWKTGDLIPNILLAMACGTFTCSCIASLSGRPGSAIRLLLVGGLLLAVRLFAVRAIYEWAEKYGKPVKKTKFDPEKILRRYPKFCTRAIMAFMLFFLWETLTNVTNGEISLATARLPALIGMALAYGYLKKRTDMYALEELMQVVRDRCKRCGWTYAAEEDLVEMMTPRELHRYKYLKGLSPYGN